MNILMALSQKEVTGAEVYAVEVGEALIKRGHTLVFVSDTLTKKTVAEFVPLAFNNRSYWHRLYQVATLVSLIKKHNIHVVHAHSRITSWAAEIACRLTKTALVSSLHGMRNSKNHTVKRRQPIGNIGIAVCEAIQEDMIEYFGTDAKKLCVIRNGIDVERFNPVDPLNHDTKVITIIGRLSGPKGQLCYELLDKVLDTERYAIRVIGGSELPQRFKRFETSVAFKGYIDDVTKEIAQADVVIGAGRVAVEALCMNRCVVAVGEDHAVGFVSAKTLDAAMGSNFGDIGLEHGHYDNVFLKEAVEEALKAVTPEKEVVEKVRDAYALNHVTSALEAVYDREFVATRENEVPVLMYHRVVNDSVEGGQHGTYVTAQQFETHLKLLKQRGYETLTFAQLDKMGVSARFDKKYVMLTFDDGYADNYTNALPLLKKYGFSAVVYLVSDYTYNEWDVKESGEKRFELMGAEQRKAMLHSGVIEFGGHTLHHKRLPTLSDEEIETEILHNKQALENELGITLLSFAYPYGDLNERCIKAVKKADYKYAVATDSGPFRLTENLFQIRRIGIFPKITPSGFLRKISGDYTLKRIKRAR